MRPIDPDEDRHHLYERGFRRWRRMLSAGEVLQGRVSDFPRAERRHLQRGGVESLVVIPIFAGEAWWGFLGFDDCVAEREWPAAEIDALKTAADTLGAAIGRRQAERLRAQAQAGQRELEVRTSAVLASAMEAIVTMDEGGSIVDFNPAAERMFGYRRDDVAGRSLAEALIPPELRHRHRAALAFYFETGQAEVLGKRRETRRSQVVGAPLELEALRSNGERFPVEITVTEVTLPNGSLFTGFIRDLTERREAEHQLRESEQRYRTLVEQLPATVYRTAADDIQTPLYLSPQYEDLFGVPVEVRLADPDYWATHIHPEDRDRVLDLARTSNRTGQPFSALYRYLAGDGRYLWVQDEAQLLRGLEGTPLYWQGIMLDVTDQKDLEAAQRESELRYRSVVENVPVITYIEGAGGLGHLQFMSHQVESILGYTVEERLADPWGWLDLVHPEDRPTLEAVEAETQVSEEPFHAEYRIRAKDGRWVWLRDDAVPIHDQEGRLAFWQGIQQDVTERREAEERLRRSEEHFRTLFEQATDGVFVADAEGRYLEVNAAACQMLGYTRQELVGMRITDVVAVEEQPRVGPGLARLKREGLGHSEWRFLRKDGSTFLGEVASKRLPDGRLQAFVRDITERRRAEEAIRAAEQRYRAIVEHVPAAIYVDVADDSTRTIYVSPQIEEIMGITPAEYLAEPDIWLDRLADESQRAEIVESYLRAIHERRPWAGEYLIRRPDGREVWVHDETTFVTDEHGEPLFIQGVMFDVTERKLAEQALRDSERREREAAERLRALDEMKNTFLAAVSHELRTPLTSILGLALTLEQQDLPRDQEQDLLSRLAGNARKLDRLLADLLDVDRISRGIVTSSVRPTDVGAIVRQAVESLDGIDEHRVRLEAHAVVVPADVPKVERIVENLVANAARHAGPEATIWVRVSASDGGALIAVEDDGPGVPVDLREEIFEPFRQGPTATSHSPGTGVGLSLVSMFAELHGGRAWVEERDGGGSSFRVFLPSDVPIESGNGGADRGAGERAAAPSGSPPAV